MNVKAIWHGTSWWWQEYHLVKIKNDIYHNIFWLVIQIILSVSYTDNRWPAGWLGDVPLHALGVWPQSTVCCVCRMLVIPWLLWGLAVFCCSHCLGKFRILAWWFTGCCCCCSCGRAGASEPVVCAGSSCAARWKPPTILSWETRSYYHTTKHMTTQNLYTRKN